MKTIKITAKCSDMFSAALFENGVLKGEYDGYVPAWFPAPTVQHYGDYVELTIDLDTGKIVNWKKPTRANLADFKEPECRREEDSQKAQDMPDHKHPGPNCKHLGFGIVG